MMNTYPENDYRNYLMHWGKSGVVERNKSAYSSVQSKVKKTTYSAERTKRIKAENATKKKDYIINAKNAKKSRKR